MDKQKVKEINCSITGYKTAKGPMAYFKDFSFQDLINWVWRTCQGCDKIEIHPDVKIDVLFEDRVETYTLKDSLLPNNIKLEK